MTERICVFMLGCAVLMCACDENKLTAMPNLVTVRVLEDNGQCVVSGHQFACDRAVSYLRDQLRLNSDTAIDVIPQKDFEHPGQDVKDVAAQLRRAGFKTVAVVGFGTYPGPNNALQRTLEDPRR